MGAAKEKVGASVLLKMGSTFLEKDGNRKGNSGRGKVIKTNETSCSKRNGRNQVIMKMVSVNLEKDNECDMAAEWKSR